MKKITTVRGLLGAMAKAGVRRANNQIVYGSCREKTGRAGFCANHGRPLRKCARLKNS